MNTLYKNVMFILGLIIIGEIQSAASGKPALEGSSPSSLSNKELYDLVAKALATQSQEKINDPRVRELQEQERELRERMYNGLVPSEQICAQTKTVFLPAGEFKTIKYKPWKSDNLSDSASGMHRDSQRYWAKGRFEVKESTPVFRGYPIDVLNKGIASLKANGFDFKKIVLVFPFADVKTSEDKYFYASFYYVPFDFIESWYPEKDFNELKQQPLQFAFLPQEDFNKRYAH